MSIHNPNDNSNNLIISPLQHSKRFKNKKKFNFITTFPKINIDNTSHSFNMKFNHLLNQIKKERDHTSKNPHITIRNILDTQINDTSNNQNVDSSTLDFDQLWSNIHKKYNCIHTDANDFFNCSSTKNIISHTVQPTRKNPNNILDITKNRYSFLNDNAIIMPRRRAPSPPPLPPRLLMRPKKKVIIQREINGLDDLITLIDDYPLKDDVEYNIDMAGIHAIKEPLHDLKNMIGMKQLKDAIVDQVIYFVQKLHKHKDNEGNDYMHTVIYGPPGTGKTEIAKIMGKIFSGVGVLRKGTFKKVTRVDLIAGYLGQTSIKTTGVVKESLGGVLFIDEAYALGNMEKRDSFAKECIDTLCEALSNHKDNLMVIIAGYKEDLTKCFFSYNQGLQSRFPWRFQTDDYTASELNKIFQKKIQDIGWRLHAPLKDNWFEPKMKHFKFYGRDMETLFSKIKIAHSRRVFCKSKDKKMIITTKDIDKGFEMFVNNHGKKSQDNGEWNNLYI